MLKSSLCECSDAFIFVKGAITVIGHRSDAAAVAADRNNKQVIFKNCVPFTDCIGKIYNTQVHYAKALDVVMPIYNLTDCSNNYEKTLESLW